MQHMRAASGGTEADDLLVAVAQQLKVPLTVIARHAELGAMTTGREGRGFHLADAELVRTQADAALQLVDCYLLGLELARGQAVLELEPVSVSSVLVDAAHALERFARQYGVTLSVEVAGRYEPVMAHPRALRAALLTLGYGLIESRSALEANAGDQRRIMLAAHRTPQGIIAGVYGNYDSLQTGQWRTALKLYGRAPQPLAAASAGSGAGLFVADAIFRSMAAQLHVSRRLRVSGLAATLQPSKQLQFV